MAVASWTQAPVEDARAHAGPPFPIVTDKTAGPYRISVWTDPDATDDGTSGGQFWIMIDPVDDRTPLPRDTQVTVRIVSRTRAADPQSVTASPENGDVTRQFAALLMDHEGMYDVRASIRGPLGAASVDAVVEATYDLRPPPLTVALYLLPFLLVGGLWLKVLLRRRGHERQQAAR